jgi:RNA polymerase sigma factor (sigma-70 family)
MSTYYSTQDNISFVPLTREEEKCLFSRYYASPAEKMTEDSVKARDEIVARHLKLVAKLSLQFAKGCLRDDDAISAGNFGLLQALGARKFDPSFGVLFSSYLRAYVRGQVLAALRENNWKGTPLQDINAEYAPDATITGKDGGEEPCVRRGHSVVVFPSHRLAERGVGPAPTLIGRATVDHEGENNQLREERHRAIEEALTKLPELEASTIRAHFFGDRNFADIGRERNLTREGVRKAFNRGLAKLKELLAESAEELC